MAAEINTMPYNRDAEMALLGCLLIDNDIAAELVEKLTEDDFYQESHKFIIRAMQTVFNDRKPIDLVTLSDQLDGEGNLEKSGGIAYLTELAQITPSAANYKSYYEIVSRDSTNRKLIRASRKIIENCMTGAEGRDAISFAEKSVYDISKQADRSSLAGMSEGDIVQQVLQKFESIQSDPTVFRGIETGFKRLDQMTNGLQPSDLIVLAARPGMGKTSLAMNLVEHAALRKNKVCAVFSLEMPRIQIVQRLLCSYANVSMAKGLSGQLSASEWKKLMLASDKLKKSQIYIDDSSRVTPAEILSKCRRLKTVAGGVDMIMIDYIQLMTGGSSTTAGSENRQQEIASITRDLKIMAKELNVPVIALSQLRRIQSKEPQISDLRESGAIEQDADIVCFIHRPEYYLHSGEDAEGNDIRGLAEFIVAKHRSGKVDDVKMRFVSRFARFQNWDENTLTTRHIVGSRLNGAGDEQGEAPDPFAGAPAPFSGGTADITSDDGAPPF